MMSFQVPVEQVLAVLLVAIRVSAWLVVAPPFNSRAMPSLVKVVLAVGLAFADRAAPERPGAGRPRCSRVLLAALFQVLVGARPWASSRSCCSPRSRRPAS